MKRFVKTMIISMFALNLAGPATAPAFAADIPTTEADCEKAGMKWKQKAGKCKPMPSHAPSRAESVLALIGIGCALVGLFFIWSEYLTD
jgi:hypothetical protein